MLASPIQRDASETAAERIFPQSASLDFSHLFVARGSQVQPAGCRQPIFRAVVGALRRAEKSVGDAPLAVPGALAAEEMAKVELKRAPILRVGYAYPDSATRLRSSWWRTNDSAYGLDAESLF